MTIIITGASGGIGKALIRFFNEIKDHRIVALTGNPSRLKEFSGNKNVRIFKSGLANPEEIIETARVVKKSLKEANVLIHNAGLLINKPFAKMSVKDLEQSYRVNVMTPYLLTQQLLPVLGKKTVGHVVNISSMGGFQGSVKFQGLSAYSSSKGALAILTECLAEELKDRNIRVNCLCLGAVNTEMLRKAFPGYKAPLDPAEMAEFIGDFAMNGHKVFNGKILPVSLSTP